MHQPSDAHKVGPCMISVNRLSGEKGRRTPFPVGDWMMDSGAFTAIHTHGGFPESVEAYAAHIRRWANVGNLLCAVAQDYMCEPFMLQKTGLTVADHQRLTIERYDALKACDTAGVYILPVLQGYTPTDYIRHVVAYGDRLAPGAWVGVGSVCKRNGDANAIAAVLWSIKAQRPDLKLHGFGLKSTALKSWLVCDLLETADSMAWSYSARKQGRKANDWREAVAFTARVDSICRAHLT